MIIVRIASTRLGKNVCDRTWSQDDDASCQGSGYHKTSAMRTLQTAASFFPFAWFGSLRGCILFDPILKIPALIIDCGTFDEIPSLPVFVIQGVVADMVLEAPLRIIDGITLHVIREAPVPIVNPVKFFAAGRIYHEPRA